MSGDDVIYYNATISSINDLNAGEIYQTQSNQYPIRAENMNSSQATQPILKNPSDYYASIIKLEFPGSTLPLMNFFVQTPVSNINLGIYSFTLSYQGYDTPQEFLILIPEASSNLAPPPPTGTDLQQFSRYYFIYSVQTYINMLNTALKNCVDNINTHFGSSISYPFFNYNANTQFMEFYGEKTYFSPNVANPVQIWFNEAMSFVMFPFPYYSEGYGLPNGKDKLLTIVDNNNIQDITYNSKTYLLNVTPYVDWGYQNLVKKIYISSNLNMTNELFFVNNPTTPIQQNILPVNVITDITPDVSTTRDYGLIAKQFIYNAPSLYRIFELKDKVPLYNINIGIFWVDILGNTYPLSLKKGTQLNVKFMFIKKTVFNKFLL